MAITPGSVTPDNTTPPAATATPAATAPAQTPATAPAQAQSPAAAPAQAQAPAQATPTPSSPTTQSGMPGIPTDAATAVATAHPTSILRGALMGILGAASKVGKGVGHELSIINQGGHVAAANTKIAQAGEIARQQQQAQAAKDAQRAAEDTHVKTGYDNAETIARTNYSANLATGQAIKNSTDQAAYSQTQRENNDKNNAADAEWIQALRDEGVPFKEDHGKSFDNLGPADAKDIVSGIYAPISNGQTGDDHGIVLLPVDIAKKTPLTKDRQTVVDWKVDPNTGAKTPVYQTFQAGTDTVFTAHEGYMVGQKKSAEADKLSEAIQKQKLNQADIAVKGAEANKANAEAENQRAQAVQLGGATMQHTAAQLVEGNEDPSQLTKRSKGYDATLAAADDYSMKNYGVHFSAAQASIDYKFATNPQTQNILKYLNSLTGADNRGGNLGQLIQLSNGIQRTQFPALNDTAAWARLQAGDPKMAAYYATVTEVADQVAKIMQGGGTGGGTSDAKMKQATDLFDKGFTKDQISAIGTQLRNLLANRKKELIGGNRYLVKQFPNVVAPNGTVATGVDANGITHYLGANNVDLGVVGYGVK